MTSSAYQAELEAICPESWKVVPLTDVVIFQEGPGILAKDFQDSGVPLIRLKGVEGDFVSLEGCNFLAPEKVASKWSHFQLERGDLVISTSASFGRVSEVTEESEGAVPYTGLIRFRPKTKEIDAGFLRAFLGSSAFMQQVEAMASGSVIRHFGPMHLKQMALPLPPISEQHAIGNIAKLIAERLRNHSQTNETLEAMARALFKAWFVDFEPVRAKMEGRWQRGESSPSPSGRGARGEGIPPPLLTFARENRQNATDAESLMWQLLRNRQLGVKFRRQHPCPPYILDFYCHEHRLAIELDGGQHYSEENKKADAKRTEMLIEQGISVLRFSNRDVLLETEGVLQAVWNALTPTPLPKGEELYHLSAHLYDLFPNRLVESELGEIPEGWELRSLDSIANYLNGLALQKFPPENETEFLPVIKIAQLRAGNTNGAEKASTQIKPKYVVVDGDVLFSWSGSLEVEVWNGGRGALNQHLFKVTSNEVPKWFYFFATRHHLSDFRAIAAGKVTTMGHIQRKHLTDARIAVAPPESMKKFDAFIAPQFDQLVINAQQSRSLAQLRDTLLPKLISGELCVPDAERFVERVGI